MNDTANSSSLVNQTFQRLPQLAPWYSSAHIVTLVVLYNLIIIVAIAGNLLVFAAVSFNSNLRKNVPTYFIVSLAISDICTACLSMPFDLEALITHGKWSHGEVMCSFWSTAYLITVPTSMWNLFALSITRYKMLRNPWDRYRDAPFLTPKRAVLIILVLWIFCLVIAFVAIMPGVKYMPNAVTNGFCYFNISPVYANVISFLSFYLPMIAMCFIYYKIYMIARAQCVLPTGIDVKRRRSKPEVPPPLSVKDMMEDYEAGEEDSQKNERIIGSSINAEHEQRGICLVRRTTSEIEPEPPPPVKVENTMEDYTEAREKDSQKNERIIASSMTAEQEQKGIYVVKQSTSEPEPENPPPLPVEDMMEDYEAREKGFHENNSNIVSSKNEDSEKCGWFYNQGLELDYNNEMELNVNQHSCVLQQNTCMDSLDDMETDYHCYTANQATSKQEKSVTLNLDPGNDDLRESVAMVTRPLPGTSKLKPTHLNVNLLGAACCDVPDHVTDYHTCSPGYNDQPNCSEDVVVKEEHNRVCAATENNLSALRNVLNNESANKRKTFVQNKKAARTIAIIVGAFLFCWMPFTTLSVIFNFCESQCYNEAAYKTSQIFLIFGYLNSAINPIIFSYKDEQFLKSYRKITKRLFPCLRNVISG